MENLPPYTLRKSRRAKHVRLSMTLQDGLVVVVPHGFDCSRVPAVLSARRDWIRRIAKRLERQKAEIQPSLLAHPPERLDLHAAAETWTVSYTNTSSTRITVREHGENLLTVSGGIHDAAMGIRGLKNWLKHRARRNLLPRLYHLAETTGVSFTRATVRFQRTRWGSCSAKNAISLNAKLLFLPPELVDYVLLHELCHTVHLNHSPTFWRLVAGHDPGCREHDRQLRDAWRYVPISLQRA